MLRYSIPAGLIAILASGAIFAQPKAPTTRPAPAATTRPAGDDKAGPEAMKVTVKSVTGIAERRDRNVKNGKWEQMKAGDILSEHTIIRTGLGGRVILQFADRGDVTIERKTKIVISSFSDNSEIATRLYLKHGAILAQMAPSQGAGDIFVHAPVPVETLSGRVYDISNSRYFSLRTLEPTELWAMEDRKDFDAMPSGKPDGTTTRPAGDDKAGPEAMKVTHSHPITGSILTVRAI